MTANEVEMDQIGKATIVDQPALTETLAQAFQTDPALSWILPDPAHRARALRGLFRTLVPADMRAGIALRTPDDEAAALWRAPGRAHSGMPEFLRRSEEHASELQSLMRISYAVFCLTKKKIKKHYIIPTKKHDINETH